MKSGEGHHGYGAQMGSIQQESTQVLFSVSVANSVVKSHTQAFDSFTLKETIQAKQGRRTFMVILVLVRFRNG